jgi:hypothetical protein
MSSYLKSLEQSYGNTLFASLIDAFLVLTPTEIDADWAEILSNNEYRGPNE